jgi:Transglycosylase
MASFFDSCLTIGRVGFGRLATMHGRTSDLRKCVLPTRMVASIGTGLATGLIAFALHAPDARDFAGGANALAFEDRAGLPLGIVLARDSEHAVRVPLERVSPLFLRAIIATEDARFAAHDGVDRVALARAASEVLRRGRVVSGGSTITMQLARLRYGLPRTLPGKLTELGLALRIERGMSKREILAAYVNRLPMGRRLCPSPTLRSAAASPLLCNLSRGQRVYIGTGLRDGIHSRHTFAVQALSCYRKGVDVQSTTLKKNDTVLTGRPRSSS